MTQTIFIVILLLITPALIVKLIKKFKQLQVFGPVFYCYLLGIILTNVLNLIKSPLSVEINSAINYVAQVFVLIAIVQMLMSTKLQELIKLSKEGLIGFSLAVISVFTSSVIIFKILPAYFPQLNILDFKHLISMAIGVYTGGTANMAVLSQSLHVNPQLYLQAYSSDLVLSGILLILLMNFLPWMFGLILNKFDFSKFNSPENSKHFQETIHTFPYPEINQVKLQEIAKKDLIAALLILISLGISFGISQIFQTSLDQVTLFVITTLTLLTSLIFKMTKKNQNEYFILGDYNLLIFCLSMGTMANLEKLQTLHLWVIAGLMGILTLSTFLHLVLSYLFRVDRDISIITFTASIFGPPFVICTSQALKNKHIITTGIATGLLGMSLGTYLGLLFFNLF